MNQRRFNIVAREIPPSQALLVSSKSRFSRHIMDAVNWHDILQHLRIRFPPSSTVSVAVLGILTLITASSYGLVRDIVRPYLSPLRSLKGPRSGSFIFGNLKEILADKSPGTWTKEMVKKYGNIFVFKVWINVRDICLWHYEAHLE